MRAKIEFGLFVIGILSLGYAIYDDHVDATKAELFIGTKIHVMDVCDSMEVADIDGGYFILSNGFEIDYSGYIN